jgi:hypothetical protein
VNYESPEAYLARVGAIRLTSEPAKPNGHDEAFDERTGPPRGEAVEEAAEIVDFLSAFDFCSAYEPIAYAV